MGGNPKNRGIFPQNGWLLMKIMENHLKLDDLGGNPPFKETPRLYRGLLLPFVIGFILTHYRNPY